MKAIELAQVWSPIKIFDDNGDPPDSREHAVVAASQRN
jgi:hypothetical protein